MGAARVVAASRRSAKLHLCIIRQYIGVLVGCDGGMVD